MGQLERLEKLMAKNNAYISQQKAELKVIKKKIENKKRSELKSILKNAEKLDCAVCGKYKEVTHAHHLTPVSKQNIYNINNHFVWLCPTHHALVHLAIKGNNFNDFADNIIKIIKISNGEI